MTEPVEDTAGTVATGRVDTGYHSTEVTAVVGCCYCSYQSSAAFLNSTREEEWCNEQIKNTVKKCMHENMKSRIKENTVHCNRYKHLPRRLRRLMAIPWPALPTVLSPILPNPILFIPLLRVFRFRPLIGLLLLLVLGPRADPVW